MTDLEQTPDEQLVASARTGDFEAFGELVRRNHQKCISVAVSILRNCDDAEDEVQTGLSKALEHIKDLHAGQHFSTWLTRIVVNECYMRLRYRKCRDAGTSDPLLNTQVSWFRTSGNSTSAETEFLYDEALQCVRFEASRVPPLLRRPLIMCDIEQRSLPEIAGELGISIGAVKSRLHRGRRELRDRLRRRGICGLPTAA
jgi:RNA polymerase sigma-70 factor (ECF subfamily)